MKAESEAEVVLMEVTVVVGITVSPELARDAERAAVRIEQHLLQEWQASSVDLPGVVKVREVDRYRSITGPEVVECSHDMRERRCVRCGLVDTGATVAGGAVR